MADSHETVSVTDSVDESQISVTESQIMNEGVHSTPVPSKKVEDNDMMSMMQLLLNKFDMNTSAVSYTHLDVYKRQITASYSSYHYLQPFYSGLVLSEHLHS